MNIEVNSESETKVLGEKIGKLSPGGLVLELVGDVGSGKTTLTKGVATGLGVTDDVQSPSYTINRLYSARDGLSLSHYDFYRLNDPGILADELAEVFDDNHTVTIIEWADIVDGVLPEDRLTIEFTTTGENNRSISLRSGGELSHKLIKELDK